jgi:amidase
MSQSTWQSIAARKQAERSSRIPKAWLLRELPGKDRLNVMGIPRECGILSPKELDITESYDATALAQAIARGRLKSVDVVTAFCKVITLQGVHAWRQWRRNLC